MERQPQLALRKSDATANVRMDCLNKETMAKHFDLLKTMLRTMISLVGTVTYKLVPATVVCTCLQAETGTLPASR